MSNTVLCPYCGRSVAATFDHSDSDKRELYGEHCDCCHMPFDIDAHGPIGQDGERPPRWEVPQTREGIARLMDALGNKEIAGTLTVDEQEYMAWLARRYPDIAAQGAGRPVDKGGPVA